METGWSYEQKTLISELIQGANFARQLNASTAETREVLIQGILSSYEKALQILKWSGPMGGHPQPIPSAPAAASSPLSVNRTPRREDFEKGVGDQIDNREASKKRKMLPKWTDQVRISPETGLEGPHNDGYSWRKYGQKDILGAKYPRSYYRCTYRNTQNCWATKQVQRSDNDPTVFEVTYKGRHSCVHGGGGSSTLAPTSPEKQEHNQDTLTRFQTGLRVETENLDSSVTEMPYPFSFPPSFGLLNSENQSFTNYARNLSLSPFLSPSTPESNYFSVSNFNVFGQLHNPHHSESDLTDLVSATTSAANSPILDLDFQLEAVGIDPNFPFDTAAFFP